MSSVRCRWSRRAPVAMHRVVCRPPPAAAVAAAPAVASRSQPFAHVMATARIGNDQRRARLVRRHLLAPEARLDDPAAVSDALVALHATDPASVHLSALARLRDGTVATVERALYDDRTVLRMLGMRRTMFVVPLDLVAVVQAACTDDVAARERRRLVGFLEANEIADPEALLSGLERDTLAALTARGQAFTGDLGDDVPGLRREVTVGSGRWTANVKLSSRVVFLLGAAGHIVRGRPRGTWLSSQYRWAPTAGWLGTQVPTLSAAEAQAELARRWLRTFGPGTVEDLKWWSGWTLTQTRRVLAAIDTVEVVLDQGAPGLLLANDTAPVLEPSPSAALLPALDPTPMGWTNRDWYLGPHQPELFDRNGNVGPTVWWGGRIVGGWGQRADGTVAYELLADTGRDGTAAVDAEAARVDAHLNGVRVIPRFRTPLERRLAT